MLALVLVLALPCRFRLLLATYGRLLVVLSLADFRENAGPCTGALESAQSTVKALVILNSDLRHLLHTPSLVRYFHCAQKIGQRG